MTNDQLTNPLSNTSKNLRPLVVDLDGTLIHTDMLHESVIRLLRDQPHLILMFPFWLLKGKAAFKKALSAHTQFDSESLPFNGELIEWLKAQKLQGRKIILCTASDQSTADAVAMELGIFDEVLASNGHTNLAGKNKAIALTERYGNKGFDYVGNASTDLAVWRYAQEAIVVNGSKALEAKANSISQVSHVISKPVNSVKTWVKVFRLHQWVKNILIFVPIFAAHKIISGDDWQNLLLAFFSFSLCASSVYIANDLLDLESDRQHPRKRFRPFAAGNVPIWIGTLLAPTLLLASFIMASNIVGTFFPCLIAYFVITCADSWGLKRLILVDCLTLAILYTLRIVAGAAAVNVPLSFWLLAFSIFLFLSLAFIKRYAELQLHIDHAIKKTHGRGYRIEDAPLIQQLGVASGYTAVLVLALYLNSENVIKLYRTPAIIWAAIPLMLLWLSWMWLKAFRGQMHDDPIVFAIKDKASILIGILFASTFILARLL